MAGNILSLKQNICVRILQLVLEPADKLTRYSLSKYTYVWFVRVFPLHLD